MLADKPFKLTGILADDAPGLNADFLKLFNAEDKQRLDDIYYKISLWGALTEAHLNRTPGSSFNPRPARIVKLILKETQICCPMLYASCFLACLPKDYINCININEQTIQNLLTEFRQLIAGNKLADFSNKAQSLYLADLLDRARHLHMSQVSQKEKQAFRSKIEGLVKPDHSLPNSSQRLLKLLEHWLRITKPT